MTDLGVLRERIIDEGRRNAYVRTAHLLYEMLVRYRMVELTDGDSLRSPKLRRTWRTPLVSRLFTQTGCFANCATPVSLVSREASSR
jgi:hypothetical protein